MHRFQTVLICAVCLFFVTSTVNAQKTQRTMTNADVVEMVAARLSEQIITTSIRTAPAKDFDLTSTGLIALKKAGVPDTVILVMQEVDASVTPVSAGSDKMPTDDKEPASNDPNAKIRQELIIIERLIGKAGIAGDSATIDKFLAEDFMSFLPNGKSLNKEQFLKQVKPQKNIAMLDMEKVNVKLESETAALTAVAVYYFKTGDIFKSKFTEKFIKSDGQWKMISSQASYASKYEAAAAQPEKLSADNGCSGIEPMGIFKNTAIDPAIGGGIVEWLAKIRNNTNVTRIVVFGWIDMYGQQQKAQVQIRGGDIASVRIDLTQARVIPPVRDLRVVSCQ
jgi:hypothetical protein